MFVLFAVREESNDSGSPFLELNLDMSFAKISNSNKINDISCFALTMLKHFPRCCRCLNQFILTVALGSLGSRYYYSPHLHTGKNKELGNSSSKNTPIRRDGIWGSPGPLTVCYTALSQNAVHKIIDFSHHGNKWCYASKNVHRHNSLYGNGHQLIRIYSRGPCYNN